MYIAIKGKDTVYLAISSGSELSMTEGEALLEENLQICIGAKGTKSLICFRNKTMITQFMKYDPEVTSKPMTYYTVLNFLVPYIKEKSSDYEQLVNMQQANFYAVVCYDNEIYEIGSNGDVTHVDSAWSSNGEPYFALKKVTMGQEDPITRFRNIFRGLERETGRKFFPISIYNAKTGKRNIVKS